MKKIIFITGTNTNIGKTIITCGILKKLSLKGLNPLGYKPIASGSKIKKKGILNNDVLKIKKYSNISIKYSYLNSITYITPNSPNLNSKIEMKSINLNKLKKQLNYLKKITNIILIEGIGGWLTPINNDKFIKNWIIKENMDIIIIIEIKVGCINHALLTSIAIRKTNLKLIGWIANIKNNKNIYINNTYIIFLKKKINKPLLGIIPRIKKKKNKKIIKYLNI